MFTTFLNVLATVVFLLAGGLTALRIAAFCAYVNNPLQQNIDKALNRKRTFPIQICGFLTIISGSWLIANLFV